MDYGATYHGVRDETLLDGRPLKKAVFENNFEALIFDFVVAEDGSILCFIILSEGVGRSKSVVEVWKLLDGSEELLNWFDQPKDTDWAKLKNESILIASITAPEEMQEMTTFSLGNRIFMFNPVTGNLFQFFESNFLPVTTGFAIEGSFLDYSLVVDRDNEKAFLIQKAHVKNKGKSFRETISLYGIEIPISK